MGCTFAVLGLPVAVTLHGSSGGLQLPPRPRLRSAGLAQHQGALKVTGQLRPQLVAQRRWQSSGTGLAGWTGVFGPCPPEETCIDELDAAEFTREIWRERDPQMHHFCDRARRYSEEENWQGMVGVIDDMWKAKLDPDSWFYTLAIEACDKVNETDYAMELQAEVHAWGASPSRMRFQLAPIVNWQRPMKRVGCHIHNTLDWKGQTPVPVADMPCWLLPSQDEVAEDIAEHALDLQRAGWKVVSSAPGVVSTLRSKALLHDFAEALGLQSLLPARYTLPASAMYPCILKPARGTWGKNTLIVYSSDEVLRTVRPGKIYEVEHQAEQQVEYRVQYLEQAGRQPDPKETWAERMEAADTAVRNWIEEAEWEDVGSDWVMQELVPGIHEYSTSLLVDNGRILDYACSRYEFSSEIYVWPKQDYSHSDYLSVPQSHLEFMSEFLVGFTGICNFNYKLRPNGQMCIFEVNPRVGGDLVFDVPKPRVRAMFEKLDAMFW